jgi:SH3-like domain-containing protein
MLRRTITLCLLVLATLPIPAAAEDGKVPFWAAVRSREVNMRVGPGEDYRITWVYRRPLLPVKVLRTMENWWLVQDPDGVRGWVLSSLMTKKRGAMVIGSDLADMREDADAGSKLMWRLAPGVTGRLGECEAGWCKVELMDKRAGWVRVERLWGAAEL